MQHALVTGASGFIGRVLCRRLVEHGVRVTALHRRSKPGPWQHELVLDLAEAGPTAKNLQGIDCVFHLAGHAHGEDDPNADNIHHRITVAGTERMLDACSSSVERFIFFSSVKAMGESTCLDCQDETAPAKPESAYGRARLEAEALVFARAERPPGVVLRLPLVYGPGVKGNLARMLAAIETGRMPLLPEFGNARSLIHVDDVCDAAIAASAAEVCRGKVYLLTDGERYSSRDIQLLMLDAVGRNRPILRIPAWGLTAAARAGDWWAGLRGTRSPFDSNALEKLKASACYVDRRARADFGFDPRRRLADALPSMLQAMHHPHNRPV